MAISKERLEELIEQGATVWHDDYGEINLDKKSCEICELQTLNGNHIGWVLYFAYEYENVENHTEVNIEHLEEDVETAKWHYEMDCQRIEYLNLPTWEKVEEMRKTKSYKGYFTVTSFCKPNRDKVEISSFSEDRKRIIFVNVELGHSWNFPYTKDGYLSACRLAKKLFLGEE